ncbi:B12-binding domain-containing radical SAM protein [uncultured Brachyspira sp.]|uniref:B12-binding domain-containing radical SAM protein n=1 Tax=uncultured Brachyspira sp. TaxID=221953 RepID=UPI00262C4DC6|nr:B12-binding domain-containing radical SAM protein [uncultured Brachyspira sp.]
MKKKEIKKVCITYPPFEYNNGYPLLSLNRQFQWLKNPSYSYPMIPSYAATLLKNNSINVIFLDTIVRNMNTIEWFDSLDEIMPDLIFFEGRTPIINYIWDAVETLKERYKNVYVVLAGDHVTALPEESMKKSKADFVLTGGDYDFLLLNLVNHINNGEKLSKGIYYRTSNDNIRNTGKFELEESLDRLPFIDRNLTNWKLYSKKNDYYKRNPGTFIMSARGAIHNNYNSNSSNILFNNMRVRNPINVIDEIEFLNKRYGIKEILDTSVYFPVGEWLSLFCETMRERKLHKKLYIDCYIYLGLLEYHHYLMMRKSGFKTVLFNFHSGNIKSLEKLGIEDNSIDNMIESIKLAKRAGLFTDMMVKIGYPWETEEDIINTFNIVRDLMFNGYINSMNVSIFIPYPGTKIFDYCNENNLINTKKWFEYDMRRTVMKLGIDDEKVFKYIEYFYNLSFTPKYIIQKIKSIRDIYDIKYHIKSFKNIISSYFGNEKHTCI